MIHLSPEEAAQQIKDTICVSREDIARAKDWIFQASGHGLSEMCADWLRQQSVAERREVNLEGDDCGDVLLSAARAYSLRLALFQAAWELVSAGSFVSLGTVETWEPSLTYRTSHQSAGIPLGALSFPYPARLHRLPFSDVRPMDVDIFLKGIDCKTLHPGILEGITQALACFRRGLYLPATGMLAAAVEATWLECGHAVANHRSDEKLEATVTDPYSGFARVVSGTCKILERREAKPLLAKAGLSIHQINDAEIWTTALRDRRNALHWGKAKSFVADHASTGTLLMAAPQHIGALEKLRAAAR